MFTVGDIVFMFGAIFLVCALTGLVGMALERK